MAYIPHNKAILAFHKKVTLTHRQSQEVAVAELRVFKVLKSLFYPEGIKYSLFLVSLENERVIIGMDNHKPKGPHLHRNGKEARYTTAVITSEVLVSDFWKMVQEEGFST